MIRRLAALLAGGFVACTTMPAAAQIGPEIAEQFDCAACHTERLREFRRRGAATLVEHDPRPTLDTGSQDEAHMVSSSCGP